MTDEKQKELDALKKYIEETKVRHVYWNLTEEDKEEIIKKYGSLEAYEKRVTQDIYDCFGRQHSVL